jgi:hypothetical protein
MRRSYSAAVSRSLAGAMISIEAGRSATAVLFEQIDDHARQLRA